MSDFLYLVTHGKVEKDFYRKHNHQLCERNVKMLKLSFTFAAVINIMLFVFTFSVSILQEMKVFYGFFSIWFVVWEFLTFTILTKHHNLAKLFYAILAASALILTALAGSLYSKDMCTVTYFVFLIFIPGLYVNRPTYCIMTTVISNSIFCMMVVYFKSDPYIINIDIINAIFCGIVGIVFNFYSINMQLENIQSSIILKEQSTIDELTALPNRRCFNRKIDDYFSCALIGEISIIMMDIDYFKIFNDTYGHLKGDECLSRVGNMLALTAKKYGVFVARYGGE